MKKNIVWLLPICILIGACESFGPHKVPDRPAALPPLKKVVECPVGGPNVITIVATNQQFSVAPPHLCVEAGDKILVVFAGNHPANTIILTAKPFVYAPWLSASNPGQAPYQATITVPADTAPATYLYNVTAIGWGTIDPMISVDD